MGWPGGFKLNEYLDLFLGQLFLLYIKNWAIITGKLLPLTPYFIRVVAVMGIFGFSTQVAIFSDLLTFLNLHVCLLFLAISKVLLGAFPAHVYLKITWMASLIYGLFDCF